MTILTTRRRPIRMSTAPSLLDFEHDMQRLFDQFLSGTPARRQRSTGWTPMMDVFRNDEDLVIEVELPGIDPEKDVEIAVEESTLTISGTRTETREIDDEARYLRERFNGSFRRELALPEGFDPDTIEASYDHGVLTITMPLPKTVEAKSRVIPVKAVTPSD